MTAKGKGGLVLSMESSLDEAHAVGEDARKRGLTIVSVYGGGFPAEEGLAGRGHPRASQADRQHGAVGCRP